MIKIHDLSKAPYSIKNASYGGSTGRKEGIIFQGEEWLVKHPQLLLNEHGRTPSYSTSPLSEYIGSHIYEILGYDVHRTILGTRNERLVVACRDLEEGEKALLEIRTIKNAYNQELNDILTKQPRPFSNSHIADIDELMIHLDYNPVLSSIPGLKQRFFEQAIVDILLGNTERTYGRWGIIREKGRPDDVAPIFGNGCSFLPKVSDNEIERLLEETDIINNSINILTAYSKNGYRFSAENFLEYFKKDSCFQVTIMKIIPLIQSKWVEVLQMIEEIPERADLREGKDILVMSNARKEYYLKQMEIRLDMLLQPAKGKLRKR